MNLFISFRLRAARAIWPATLLVLLLQRTPVLRVLASTEFAFGVRTGQLLRALVPIAATAAAVNTLTGATQFTTTPGSPANGKVGEALAISFVVTGALTPAGSYGIDGVLPTGLAVPGATVNGNQRTLNATSGFIAGTPTQSGTFDVTLSAFEFSNRTGDTIPQLFLTIVIAPASGLAPTFSQHPQPQTVNAGASATFTVAATGTPAPTFQWRKNSVDIAGQTSATLIISNVQAGDAASYDCVATNSGGSATSNSATLTVQTPPGFAQQPSPVTVAFGGDATFTVAVTGSPIPTLQWRKGGVDIVGETAPTLRIFTAQASDAGSYDCVATNVVSSTTSTAVSLTVGPPPPPTIATQPVNMTSRTGTIATFTVLASGAGPLTYQWRQGAADINGATASTLMVLGVLASDAGSYSVKVTNAGGTVTSDPATLTVQTTGSARLANLSARAQVGTGGDILIPGFVVDGSGTKNLLVRAVGPKLADFGVAGSLADPTMTVFTGGGNPTAVQTNDDWPTAPNQAAMETARSAVLAFGLTPSTKDSSLLLNLSTGSYTVQASGVGATTGVSLVELYDTDPASSPARLSNISARAQVGTGANILIPGFVIEGDVAMTLLVRGVGPTLGGFGVPGVLADPTMTIFSGSTPIATNDNWEEGPNIASLQAATAATFAFPLNAGSKDAAILISLNPGAYTVQVSGKNDTTGVALVELYRVGP